MHPADPTDPAAPEARSIHLRPGFVCAANSGYVEAIQEQSRAASPEALHEALAERALYLEHENARLTQQLAERDSRIADLRHELKSLAPLLPVPEDLPPPPRHGSGSSLAPTIANRTPMTLGGLQMAAAARMAMGATEGAMAFAAVQREIDARAKAYRSAAEEATRRAEEFERSIDQRRYLN